MAKERIHITVTDEAIRFALTQIPYFNDSMSAYVCYCISLHKQILANQGVYTVPRPLTSPVVEQALQPMQYQSQPAVNPIQQEPELDDDVMASINNILNL